VASEAASKQQGKRSHAEPTNLTRTLILNAPATQHEIKLIKSVPALTPREVEIVRLLRKGYSNKEIAQELGIAVTTVKWNMTNNLGKFEVQSSRQLFALLAKLPRRFSRMDHLGKVLNLNANMAAR
jgi:DNA-binding CsgD family transcriptional regulator